MKCLKEANPDRIETENRLMVARSWVEEWGVAANGHGVSFWGNKYSKIRQWVFAKITAPYILAG